MVASYSCGEWVSVGWWPDLIEQSEFASYALLIEVLPLGIAVALFIHEGGPKDISGRYPAP